MFAYVENVCLYILKSCVCILPKRVFVFHETECFTLIADEAQNNSSVNDGDNGGTVDSSDNSGDNGGTVDSSNDGGSDDNDSDDSDDSDEDPTYQEENPMAGLDTDEDEKEAGNDEDENEAGNDEDEEDDEDENESGNDEDEEDDEDE